MQAEERFESLLVEFEEELSANHAAPLAPFLDRAPCGYEAEMCAQLLTSAIRRSAGGNDPVWIDAYLDDCPRDLWQFRTEICLALTDALYHTSDAESARRLGVLDFGDYRGIAVAGFGGFGVIIKARHRRDSENLVAVKLAHPRIDGAATLLDVEQDVLQRLRGRNISGVASLLDSGICKRLDSKFIITSWMPGQPLDQWLQHAESCRPDRMSERLQLAYQLVRIVRDVNAAGHSHGDLSLGNILIDAAAGGPHVSLVDFGNSVSGFIRNRKLGFSAAYAAPELLLGKASRASTATDMWNLGAMLATLLSGRHPYGSIPEDMTFEEMGTHFSKGTLTSPPDPALAKLWQALQCCLTPDPIARVRYMTLDTLLRAVESTQEFPVVPTAGFPRAEPSIPRSASRQPLVRFRRTLMSSLAAILMLSAAAVAYHFHTAAPAGASGIATIPLAESPTTHPTEFTNSIGMKFRFIPSGKFTMGSPASERAAEPALKNGNAEQQREVQLTRPFYMSIYHITRGQFAEFVTATRYETDAEKEQARNPSSTVYTWLKPGFAQPNNHPVVAVSWYDAVAFTQWLTEKEGKLCRLPLQAEWEYACRAGTTTKFNLGDVLLPEPANFGQKGPNFHWTTPGGSFPPNKWGLYDMHGNAWQWCYDRLTSWADGTVKYPDQITDSKTDNVERIMCGGSWSSPSVTVRCANRWGALANTHQSDRGFRVILELR